jgi:hypothetical protein
MMAGFVDGAVPFGRLIREAAFGGMGIDTAAKEYKNTEIISTGVAGSPAMMTTFSELLNSSSDLASGQQQQRAAEQFPSLVQSSHMKLWQPGRDLPLNGAEVVWIAVASYSVPDLELLDAIEAKLKGGQTETIYLFDLSAFPDFKDFERVLPGIGRVYQTPVVGSWNDGVLKERLSGAVARAWLSRRYELALS